MNTDTAHATDARVAPPTPDDYLVLRACIDRPRDQHRPLADCADTTAARAAWWSRLTTPRREAGEPARPAGGVAAPRAAAT